LALFAVIDPTIRRSTALPDLEKTPPGRVRHAKVKRKQVARLNRVTVMNADELVFSPESIKPVRRLVRNHQDFKVTVEHTRFPRPEGGYIAASTLVVRCERRGD
jgi:hypothetical protein